MYIHQTDGRTDRSVFFGAVFILDKGFNSNVKHKGAVGAILNV